MHHKIILPVAEVHQLVVDILHVDLLPKDGEVPANNDYQNGMVRIFKQCLTNIFILVKVKAPVDAVNHVVVKLVQTLKQVQLLLDQVEPGLIDDYYNDILQSQE